MLKRILHGHIIRREGSGRGTSSYRTWDRIWEIIGTRGWKSTKRNEWRKIVEDVKAHKARRVIKNNKKKTGLTSLGAVRYRYFMF